MFSYSFRKAKNSTESINRNFRRSRVRYQNSRLGYVQGGSVFFISLKVKPRGDRFFIDFSLKNGDKALRLAARLSTNSLAFNSRIAHKWEEEEIYTGIPFQLTHDRYCEIEIFFTNDDMFLAYNGLHVTTYEHRLPCQDIYNVKVRGDVTEVRFERKNVSQYPTQNNKTPHILRWDNDTSFQNEDVIYRSDSEESTDEKERERAFPLPYYVKFQTFVFGKIFRLSIRGRIRRNSEFFQLVLQTGQQIIPQPSIALLLEFHFKKQDDSEITKTTVLRNSCIKGRWSDEIKSEMATGLRHGDEFNLSIEILTRGYQIYINGKFVTDYPYKIEPFLVNTCFLNGDIKISEIGVEKFEKFKDPRTNYGDRMLAIRRTKSYEKF